MSTDYLVEGKVFGFSARQNMRLKSVKDARIFAQTWLLTNKPLYTRLEIQCTH